MSLRNIEYRRSSGSSASRQAGEVEILLLLLLRCSLFGCLDASLFGKPVADAVDRRSWRQPRRKRQDGTERVEGWG